MKFFSYIWNHKRGSVKYNEIRQCIWRSVFFLLFRLLFCKKIAFFHKFFRRFWNLRLGVCLGMCLKFPKFEAGCTYKLIAYKIKNVYSILLTSLLKCSWFLQFLYYCFLSFLTLNPMKATTSIGFVLRLHFFTSVQGHVWKVTTNQWTSWLQTSVSSIKVLAFVLYATRIQPTFINLSWKKVVPFKIILLCIRR